MHKFFKRDPSSSGSQSPVAGRKDLTSDEEEYFDSKPLNDDESAIHPRYLASQRIGNQKSRTESEEAVSTTARNQSYETRQQQPSPGEVVSITSSGKRSGAESSYPDDEMYETCEDQSDKDPQQPVTKNRGSPDESRYNSDTSSVNYAQLKNFAGLSSSLLNSSKPRSMSIDDQMSQVSSLSSMSMEPSHGQLAGLAFLNVRTINGLGGGTSGSGAGTGVRHDSQDTEPSYALSILQDEVGVNSGVEEEFERHSALEAQNHDNNHYSNNSNGRTEDQENLSGVRPESGNDKNHSLGSNGDDAINAHHKMQLDDEKLIMNSLFSLHQPYQTVDEASLRHSNSFNSLENQFYTQSVKVTSTMPDNRTCLFKDKLRLVQTLKPHDGSIWTMKFSPSGFYLATGGQDMKVIIWAVGRLPHHHYHESDEKDSPDVHNTVDEEGDNDSDNEDFLEEDDDINTSNEKRMSVIEDEGLGIDKFVHPNPYRIFEGHSGDVIDISWSKSNFILSASMDQTVRLWHVTRNDCLQYFRHTDVVTCVEFHPTVDRYFITGCFDRKLRVWDIIPDGIVKEWVQSTDTITSISFSPDGGIVASGLIQGQIFFYEYEGLKYKTQIDCRNRNGKYKKGTKVTGMCFNVKKDAFQQMQQNATTDPDSNDATNPQNDTTSYPPRRPKPTNKMPDLLISTNDSRIRYCRLEDYSFTCKYKGLTNKTMQIKATFSDDGRLIISGSEDGMVYIWRANEDATSRRYSMFKSSDIQRNTFFESFAVAYDNAATVVSVFAPSESVKHFVRSQDKLLTLLKNTGSSTILHDQPLKDHPKRNSKTFRGLDLGRRGRDSFIGGESMSGIGGALDSSCRVIATADSDGYMRFFFRLS